MWRGVLILTVYFFCYFILPINLVLACSVDGNPRFYIDAPNLKDCFFSSYNESLSSDVDIIKYINDKIDKRKPWNARCHGLSLTDHEQETFRNAINRFNKMQYFFASIHFVKQSDEEYRAFIKHVDKTNADECDCVRLDILTRENNWTVYLESTDCEWGPDCIPRPPSHCGGRVEIKVIIKDCD
jgi:hypothetical protein